MNIRNIVESKNKKFTKEECQQLTRKTTNTVRNELTEEDKKELEMVDKFVEGDEATIVKKLSDYFGFLRDNSLDSKVDDYIKWNYENLIRGQYTDIGEYNIPIDLRNFIEKMAVWYELRYPSYEINRLMPGSNQERTIISNVMFNNNNYINGLFDENGDIRILDWDEFYNTDTFIKSLPFKERFRFERAKYQDFVYLDPSNTLYSPHLHLTPKGIVIEAEGVYNYSNFKITNEELEGMHVKDVLKLLKEKEISLPSDNELESSIKNTELFIKEVDGMLDAVMYRIIERGGNRIGPRRGFLFAKEFGRNIDIPMMYGVDYSDPGLRRFINEYIKAGGSKDLICYVGYFSKKHKMQKLDTVSIQELLLTQGNNGIGFYTEEETEYHQRIVNALASQINQDGFEKNDYQDLVYKDEDGNVIESEFISSKKAQESVKQLSKIRNKYNK